MTTNSSTGHITKDEQHWPGIIRAALVATLLALFLLLGVTMVQHRFFRGGRVDAHGVLRP